MFFRLICELSCITSVKHKSNKCITLYIELLRIETSNNMFLFLF